MALTDAKVWDRMHEVFGIGDWDPETSTKSWAMYRIGEIGVMKRIRSTRKVTPEELLQTVEYCRAKGIDIRHPSWLYKHLRDAQSWARAESAAEATRDIDDLIREAIEIEIEAATPDSPWLDRLIRAAGDYREEVYREWASSFSSRPQR